MGRTHTTSHKWDSAVKGAPRAAVLPRISWPLGMLLGDQPLCPRRVGHHPFDLRIGFHVLAGSVS